MNKYHVNNLGNGTLRVTKETVTKRFSFSKLRSILETNYELVNKEGSSMRKVVAKVGKPTQPAEYHSWDKVMKEIKKWHNGDESAYEVVNKPAHVKK